MAMVLLAPLLSCCFSLALFAYPANGLIAPRPSLIPVGFSQPFNNAIQVHDRAQRCNHRIGKWGLLRSGYTRLQNDNDGDGGEININKEDPLAEESTVADTQQTQQQRQQQQTRQQFRGNNNPDPYSPAQIMSIMGTSPRRIFLSLSSSTAIALAANFFGITSNVLSALPPEFGEKSGLDTYYPRGDYKRAVVRAAASNSVSGIPSSSGKCSFLIPKEWVADTGLALAQAQRQAKALDYSMASSSSQQQGSSNGNTLPDAAYGPPGRLDSQGLSNGDTNVSVIVNTGVRNFSLASSLGNDPKSAAEVVLSLSNSRRTLVSAVEERRGDDDDTNGNGVPVYIFEYTVDRGERAKPLRALSVVAGSRAGDAFVTLTVVSTEEEWEKPRVAERLRKIVESFKLV
eukprot:CAMPEP_0201599498 /NCGR_PEP_ID=MMETSP0492-20130828/922_1 /ASSEMBLY_ACC=CAM_ASM_000837 /TAXON_ID=420259 /ORGANISM="Thalassiosira gravida, Strain GMp14c1" /LENGTH=400 /DNA_ID=CAMNT_0048062081 /DNA_START=32 /DNA_END=1234 /DNA_ORIENTATION=-